MAYMATVYCKLIEAGEKTLEDVPANLRDEVAALLVADND